MRPDTALSPQLSSLVESIRTATRAHTGPAATAESVGWVLAERVRNGLDIPRRFRRYDPEQYVQHIMHVEPDGSFSIVALVWLPGQRTAIHDHVSWCVAGVIEGEEHEERYARHDRADGAGAHLTVAGETTNPVGAISALAPPGDIHRVRNCCDIRTISLHIYGANIEKLGSSIRRTYTDPVVR